MVLDDPAMVGEQGERARAPRLVIHVPRDQLKRYGQKGFGLYARLAPALRERGLEVPFVARPSTTELAHYTREDFHLVHHGFLRRFNLLNCGIAYLSPYWYLDQRGVLCDSSMARARPDLGQIPLDRARKFARPLADRLSRKGASKYTQPDRRGACARGKIVVFLQGMSEPVMRSMAIMETEMLDLVMAHRAGREVVIKPHPKWPDTMASVHAERLGRRNPAVQIVDANVHDLLEGAHCSVSICSGACFEGLFHHTPAILFGRADFAACAWSVETPEEAAEAFARIRDVTFDYDRFLFWFLRRKMFSAHDKDLADRVIQRITRTGFDLGLGVASDADTGEVPKQGQLKIGSGPASPFPKEG